MTLFLVGLVGLSASATIIVVSLCILSSRLSRGEQPLPADRFTNSNPVLVRRSA